ncbi:hypothetical protein ABPG72_017944 [Tetrahymena utriculariae]
MKDELNLYECLKDQLNDQIQKLSQTDPDGTLYLNMRQFYIDDSLNQLNLISKNNIGKNITKAFFRYNRFCLQCFNSSIKSTQISKKFLKIIYFQQQITSQTNCSSKVWQSLIFFFNF